MPKQDKKTAAPEVKQAGRTRILTPPPPLEKPGDEPWRKYCVQPNTDAMPLDTEIDPERGIGARIAFCRGQLDNLSVEALSRYTRKFDREGISRSTLVRYEAGDFVPGARELRILTDALWVPAAWLLLGTWSTKGVSQQTHDLVHSIEAFIDSRIDRGHGGLPSVTLDWLRRSAEDQHQAQVVQRQRWLHEARSPGGSA